MRWALLLARRQLRRNWQTSILLLFMFALVMSFFPLTDLYAEVVTTAEFERQLEQLSQQDTQIDFTRSLPFTDEETQAIDTAFSGFVTDRMGFQRSAQVSCDVRVDSDFPPRYRTCLRPFAYTDFSALFTVTTGREPSENDDVIEAVILPDIIAQNDLLDQLYALEIGQRYLVSNDDDTLTIEIVGIAEPRYAQDAQLWAGQAEIFGLITLNPEGQDTLDIGVIVPPSAFETLTTVYADMLFTQRLTLDPAMIDVSTLPLLVEAIDSTSTVLQNNVPTLNVVAPVTVWADRFNASLAQVRPPMILLAFLLVCLLLYAIATISGFILSRQHQEWQLMVGRGGRTRQLLGYYLLSQFILIAIAFLLAPLLALLILGVFQQVEGIICACAVSITWRHLALSLIASLLSVLAVTFPAWTVIRTQAYDNRRVSVAPFWKRYGVDLLFVVIGAGLTLRLYSVVDTASDNRLNDPFNLIGLALLLAGLCLLWVRVLPVVIRLLRLFLNVITSITGQLAFWTVERDTGTVQFVILLLATVTVGVTALILNETRYTQALTQAQQEIGADVRISISPQFETTVDWESLPDVVAVDRFALLEMSTEVTIVGVVDAETSQADAQLSGLGLPADTIRLQVQAYGESSDPPTEIALSVQIIDANFVSYFVPMQSDEEQTAETWLTFTASLDPATLGQAPWRLAGLRIESTRADAGDFTHRLYLDDLKAVTEAGETISIADFEGDSIESWSSGDRSGLRNVVLTYDSATDIVAEGASSARLLYNIAPSSVNRPVFIANPVEPELQAILSPDVAQAYGEQTTLRRALEADDVANSNFGLIVGDASETALRLGYTVADVQAQYPILPDGESFVVVNLSSLQQTLNQTRTDENFIGVNRVYLTLNDVEPSSALQERLSDIEGVQQIETTWQRLNEIRQDPLSNGISGLLTLGFWMSLLTILGGFTLYLSILFARRRAEFSVLIALGWTQQQVGIMLIIEQILLLVPALLMGIVFGVLMASLLAPFLSLMSGSALAIPISNIVIFSLTILFALAVVLVIPISRIGQGNLVIDSNQ